MPVADRSHRDGFRATNDDLRHAADIEIVPSAAKLNPMFCYYRRSALSIRKPLREIQQNRTNTETVKDSKPIYIFWTV